jgi:murein DD-endopeptidase MepM/ murein hydrolase activator NlpD
MNAARLAALIVGALILVATPPAYADSSTDQLAQDQARQALFDQVKAQLGSNLADALAAQDQLEKSLKDNADQQARTQAKIDAANAKLAELDAEISKLDDQIEVTQRRVEEERSEIASLAKAIYVQPGSILVMLAQSRSLQELFTRVADLASAGSRARTLKAQLRSDEDDLAAKRDRVSADRDQQETLRQNLVSDLGRLQELQKAQEDSKNQLAVKIAQTKYELGAVNQQSAQLAQEITDLLQQQQDQIIATAMQQVWDQVKVWEDQNSGTVFATSAGHSQKYRFIWPEPKAQVVQPFGPSTLAIEPPFNGFPHFHTGIDLVEPDLSPIQAADDGVVVLVGSGPYGYGNYVVLAHQGGLTTLYGHLNKALVKVGDVVTQGQLIGLEGSTGNSTGPHLHFELRIAEKPVDPAPYLPPGPPSDFKG